MSSFTLEEIRSAAKDAFLNEVQFNEKSRVIAFKPRNDDDVRINVYYTTGTVGTYLEHPRQGKTQLFRRKVDLELLREIFKNPRVHTSRGYQLKDKDPIGAQTKSTVATSSSNKDRDGRSRSRSPRRDNNNVAPLNQNLAIDSESNSIPNTDQEIVLDDEESAVKNQLEFLLKEKDALENEIEGVREIIDSFEKAREQERKKQEEEEAKKKEEEEREKQKEAARAQLEIERTKKGKYIEHNGLKDSEKVDGYFDADMICISIGGYDCNTAVFVKENGCVSHGRALTKDLFDVIRARRWGNQGGRPVYVAQGSQERYFVECANGTQYFSDSVPDSLKDKLRQTTESVAEVAFGKSRDIWFIVYKDGAYDFNGFLPDGLRKILSDRNQRNRSDLEFVSLGPKGEWFLKANGKVWKGGFSDACKTAVESHTSIKGMWFGENDAFIVRYS